MNESLHPIAHIQTPYPEKFGIPRQPLLVSEAWGRMVFPKNDFFTEAFRGIEEVSHLWLVFSFHQAIDEGAKALVRLPRFGGKEKRGVFASRSPHRPNHLGLSVVKFERLELTTTEVILHVSGVDLVDGTPIFDIKPYLPYVDCLTEARAPEYEKPTFKKVDWLVDFEGEEKGLIEKVVALDPRPPTGQFDEFGVSVAGYNVRFRARGEAMEITLLEKIHSRS
jgi:tRNA-Thr(GGU) m(6)t(6)A37 methyltransferase TsaA